MVEVIDPLGNVAQFLAGPVTQAIPLSEWTEYPSQDIGVALIIPKTLAERGDDPYPVTPQFDLEWRWTVGGISFQFFKGDVAHIHPYVVRLKTFTNAPNGPTSNPGPSHTRFTVMMMGLLQSVTFETPKGDLQTFAFWSMSLPSLSRFPVIPYLPFFTPPGPLAFLLCAVSIDPPPDILLLGM